MIANNSQRLNIVLNQKDPFSYEEFSKACENNSAPQMHMGEWAHKIGVIFGAKSKYPDLDPLESYLLFSSEVNNHDIPATNRPENTLAAPCGGCGGGQVR